MVKKSLMSKEEILIKSVVLIFFNPFSMLVSVVCRYRKGQRKLSPRIKVPASKLSNKNIPQKSPKIRKNKVHPKPKIRLKKTVFRMVFFTCI